jgi:hypothetical protein
MEEKMKKHISFFAGYLLILLCTTSMLASAAGNRTYEKSVSANALPESPTYLVINLYETPENTVPVDSQTFYPGEWQLKGDSNRKTLSVTMLDTSYLAGYDELWAETEVDGVIVGPRVAIAIIEPGMSVGGTIESRSSGFKFPDATMQTTAGATPADLASHQANASAHHSPLVTTTQIVDGTILPADLNQGDTFIFRGMRNTGGDFNFWDTNHAMRWKDAAGANQRALIQIYSTWWKFEHTQYSNRPVIYSDSNGIGIGTNTPTASHAVTMPSLNVTGKLEIGLTTVSVVYRLESEASCHSAGNLSCYVGSGTAQCPVGTKVIGGGTEATDNAKYGSISTSYPVTDTSWTCSSSYDVAQSNTCYAICARLE